MASIKKVHHLHAIYNKRNDDTADDHNGKLTRQSDYLIRGPLTTA
jgi:hypothetical protein